MWTVMVAELYRSIAAEGVGLRVRHPWRPPSGETDQAQSLPNDPERHSPHHHVVHAARSPLFQVTGGPELHPVGPRLSAFIYRPHERDVYIADNKHARASRNSPWATCDTGGMPRFAIAWVYRPLGAHMDQSIIRTRKRRRGRFLISLSMAFSLIGTGVVVLSQSAAFADCPSPSWLEFVAPSGRLNSRTPTSQSQPVPIRRTDRVTHWGDVKPHTTGVFFYHSFLDGVFLGTSAHVTNPSRDNGVIHHEFEYKLLSSFIAAQANRATLSFRYTDECTGAVTDRPTSGSSSLSLEAEQSYELTIIDDPGGGGGEGGGGEGGGGEGGGGGGGLELP